ncbi:MAG: glycosyltransferase family 4 protein [Syntrophobacterales bacterium]|jgi:UDP-glucose:(heptosyl)LPS alpha-1,3-glucosyltransferase|nr:glycosyltransferase family 4 protein [Syntrophobacterales bacterium]
MKIALLRQRVTALGGAETTLGYLVRGLAAAGHDVAVYGTEPPDTAQAALPPGVSYVQVPVWGGKTLRLLTFALNSRRLLHRAADQVVFSLERVPDSQVYRAGDGCHREWLARRAPYLSPAARAAQRLSPFHRVMLLLERRLFTSPGLRRVIANSRQAADEVSRHYGVDPARIRVIYNGLDRARFYPLEPEARLALRHSLGTPPAREVLLFVGSGFARKGLTYLLQAFGGLNNSPADLWVVGKGHIAPYQRLAERLKVADRVRFWGPVPDAAPFYQAATVLALPTLYDPCSNVVLEALACGTPAVTTAANGAAEFIIPGANGAILPRPDDSVALREALAAFLKRGRDESQRRAAADAVATLSWEKTVARTLEVLKEAGS